MKHKGRKHDCTFSIFVHRVENALSGEPFYIKWHYKRENGKTKGRIAGEDGVVDFGEEFSFNATLYESEVFEERLSHTDSDGKMGEAQGCGGG